MLQRIARQFAGSGDHLGLIHQAELELDRHFPHLLPDRDNVGCRSDRNCLRRLRAHPASLGGTFPRLACSSSIPDSTFSAVRTPGSDMPNSTSVMATAGCMPTTTVSASKTRAMAAMFASIRPMKESTISSEEISISTPLAPGLGDLLREVVLQGHGQTVVHIHLDGHQQVVAHAQNRNALHQASSAGVARRHGSEILPPSGRSCPAPARRHQPVSLW